MKLCVFAIYDEKAKAFLPPFFLPNPAMALRTFADCVNDPVSPNQHAFARHPSDYTLFGFGFFDQDSGKFELSPQRETLANGVMVVNKGVTNANA